MGRHDELRTIDAWLEGASGHVLVLEGEAGIGKTTLWRDGVERARARGYSVLTSASAETEAQVSFTALRDVLDAAFDDAAAGLPSPQRRALAVVLLREEPGEAPSDPGAVAVALLNTLRRLSETRPVLVAVDDVQWLDGPSAHALGYALRRIEGEPVAFALARRPGHDDALGLARLREQPTTIELGPLSIGALGRVLQEELGTSFPRPTLARLHEATGGNPFYALELARTLGPQPGPLRPGDALHVHESLPALVRERFTALDASTADALAFAAALSRPTLTVLRAAVGHDVEPVLAPAVAAGLVEPVQEGVRFTHPLFAAEAYELASPARRREIHAALAEVAQDQEERARHLALATEAPSLEAAEVLEGAARAAAARGAATAAAELAEAAYRLTPPEDAGRCSSRSLDAGWFQFIVGDASRARELLEESAEVAPPGILRARARTRLGWLEHHAGDRRLAVGHYRAALEDTDDPRQRAEIFSLLAWSFVIRRADTTEAARYAAMAVELCDTEVDDALLLADSLSVLAQSEFFLGGGLPSATMERALALQPGGTDIRVLRRPTNHWAFMLLCADRFDEARPLFERVRDRALELGDESAVPWPLMRLSHLELAAGNWAEAERYAQEGLEAAVLTGQAPVRADLICTTALVLAHLGRLDEARLAASEGLALSRASGTAIGDRLATWALGMIDLVSGDAAAAARRLGALWDESQEVGVVEPGENRYLGDLGAALVQLEDLAGAERLADELGELGARLDRPSAAGVALRIRGLATAARGEREQALTLLREAEAAHAAAGLPFEHARTLLALGMLERQARERRAARVTLQRAHERFDQLGAALWSERARYELGRIGGRAPSSGALTPTEERIAALVAEGRSNKEVATELVVSVHTVESTLKSIYRKLDVRSRTELAHRLATQTAP